MQSSKNENIIFYLDLIGKEKKLIKLKDIKKSLVSFIESKREKNPSIKFGVFFFKEGGNPDSLFDQNQIENLINKIKNDWKERESEESLLENGLMFCLSHIASKASERSGDYRIIVISDSPSNKSDEYQDAIFGLINTVRYFPTFIDIIRIGTARFYKDDVKLRIITNTASGGLFYVSDSKELEKKLEALAKNKKLADLSGQGKIFIDEENRDFYENLAAELITPSQDENVFCSYCKLDECEECGEYTNLVKCSCGLGFHLYHAAVYSFEHNVGLPHLFRCPKCDTLLKLDHNLVLKINGIEPEPTISQELKLVVEEQENPEIKEIMDIQYGDSIEDAPKEVIKNEKNVSNVPVSPGGVGFFTRTVPRVNNLNEPEMDESKNYEAEITGNYSTSVSNEEWKPDEPPKSINLVPIPKNKEILHNPEESKIVKKKRIRKFKLCQMCGETNSGYDKICKKCKSPL